MDDIQKSFSVIRKHLQISLYKKAEFFLQYEMIDPYIKFTFLTGIYNILKKEMIRLYPDFPLKFLPQCKMRIFAETLDVEIAVQNYMNYKKDLIFLGCININNIAHDLYIKDTKNIAYDQMFFARYGNDKYQVHSGSKQAVDEYMLGIESPLSIAYSLALEDGLIAEEEE